MNVVRSLSRQVHRFADRRLGRGPFRLSAAAPTPLLLDNLTATAATAASVRKIKLAYSGPCMRVRRSSDNTETDIGFVGNDLDTASLLAFVGGGNGYVTKFYDQSGNGRDFLQATAANQPIICQSGAVYTQNGKPSLFSDGARYLETAGFAAFSAGFTGAFVGGATADLVSYPTLGVHTVGSAGKPIDVWGSYLIGGSLYASMAKGIIAANGFSEWVFAAANGVGADAYYNGSSIYTNASVSGLTDDASATAGIMTRGDHVTQLYGSVSEAIYLTTKIGTTDLLTMNTDQTAYYSLPNTTGLINVNFKAAAAPVIYPNLFAGAANTWPLLGTAADGQYWNRYGTATTGTVALYDCNNNPTQAVLSLAVYGGGFADTDPGLNSNFPTAAWDAIGQGVEYSNDHIVMTLTGLPIGRTYTLAIYAQTDTTNRAAKATITGVGEKWNTGNYSGAPGGYQMNWTDGRNALIFTGTVDSTGTITCTVSSTIAANFVILNGFQLKIDPTPPAPLLLDSLTTAVARAYSVRKLRRNYAGPALRARRSSDNVESDIPFLSGTIDNVALLAFVGAGNDGYVTKWYDQSTTPADAVQATASKQPRVVISGALVTAPNGKSILAGMSSGGNAGQLVESTFICSNPMSISAVASGKTTAANYQRLISCSSEWVVFLGATVSNLFASFAGHSSAWNDVAADTPNKDLGGTDTPHTMVTTYATGSTGVAPYFDGTALDLKVGTMTSTASVTIGPNGPGYSSQPWLGNIGEVLLANAILAPADITAIYGSQKTYYGTP